MDRLAKPAVSVMSLDDIANSLAEQVTAATQAVRVQHRGLRLVGIELMVKGRATSVASNVALDLGSAQRDSSLSIGLSPAAGQAAVSSQTAIVPDVRGYTESLARRKLAQRDLRPLISGVANAQGTVTEQAPAPGTTVVAGSLVRLVIVR